MLKVLILIIVSLIFIIVCLKNKKCSLYMPSMISLISIFFGIIFYFVGYENWDNNLNNHTFLYLFLLILVLFLISFLSKRKSIKCIKENQVIFSINKLVLLHIVFLALTFLYFIEILKCGINNGISFFQAISFVKENYQNGIGFNPIVRQFYKLVYANAIINCYLFVDCLIKNKFHFNIRIFLFFLNILLGFIINILSGSRGDILKLSSIILFFYAIISQFTFNNYFKNRKKVLVITICISISLLIIFYFVRNIVKSFSNGSNELAFFDYFSYYFGSPVEVLNIKIQKGIDIYKTQFFMGNTFESLYEAIFDDFKTAYSHVYLGNYDFGGNVSTILGRLLMDLSAPFAFIFIVLFYFISNYFFSHFMNGKYSIIILGYIFPIFIFAFYDFILYQYLSITGILTFLAITLVYFLYFGFSKKDKFYISYCTNYKYDMYI